MAVRPVPSSAGCRVRTRATAAILLTALGSAAAWAVSAQGEPIPGGQATVYVTVREHARIEGHGVEWWRTHAVRNRRTINDQNRSRTVLERRLRVLAQHNRALQASNQRRWAPTVALAAKYARSAYGVDLTGRIRCESHGNVYAHNASGAAGLLQFLPSTWATTPFAGFSIWDPVAQALAGGWMVRAGRSGEWSCGL